MGTLVAKKPTIDLNVTFVEPHTPSFPVISPLSLSNKKHFF